MSLSMLLDIIWAEIYDDCSPMGDQHQYREIVTALYWEGKDPHQITFKDSKGNTRRLSDQPRSGPGSGPSDAARAELRQMQEQARRLAEANQLASSPNE